MMEQAAHRRPTEPQVLASELRAVARTLEIIPEFIATEPGHFMDTSLAKRICRDAAKELEATQARDEGDA